MPDNTYVRRLIDGLPCRIALPEEWTDFFSLQGPAGTRYDEQRSVSRFHYRSVAGMTIRQTLPAKPRGGQRERVFVKDISRTGIAFLHSEQLFPCEEVELLTVDGVARNFRVARCRKLRDSCYEAAGRYLG